MYEVAIALITLICGAGIKMVRPRWPGLLMALIIGSLACLILHGSAHGVRLLGALPVHSPGPASITNPEQSHRYPVFFQPFF